MAFIQHLKTIDEMIDQSMKLDLATSHPVYFANGDESKFLVIKNNNTDQEVCTTSKRYSLLQHKDALNLILSGIEAAGITGQGTMRNYHDTVVVETYFDNLTIRDHSQDGHIQLGLMFSNSYNKSVGFNADIMMYRQVCSNGMLGTRLLPNAPQMKFKHFGNVKERITDAIKHVIQGIVKMEGSMLQIIDEARHEIITFEGHDHMINFMSQYVGSEKRAEQVYEIEGIELETDKWTLYNALTSFVSHQDNLSFNQYNKIHQEAQSLLLHTIDVNAYVPTIK